MKTKLFISGLALMALIMSANAQDKNPGQSQQQTNTPAPRGAYTDANNNGICDYYEQPGTSYRYGRGMGYMSAPRSGYGRGYAAGRGGMGPGYGRGLAAGQGRGLGPGQGQGLAPGGRYFVDTDKNGVCDRYEQIQRDQTEKK